jgi:hypothetical protein
MVTKGIKSFNRALSRATREARLLKENPMEIFDSFCVYAAVTGVHQLKESDEQIIERFKKALSHVRFGGVSHHD